MTDDDGRNDRRPGRSRKDHSGEEVRKAFVNGEKWAVDLVADYVMPIIRERLYRGNDVDDARQEVLLGVLIAFRKPERIEKHWGLVRKITICTVADINRGTIRLRNHFVETVDLVDEFNLKILVEILGPGKWSENLFGTLELCLYVFQRLREICRRLIRKRFEGFSFEEIAEEMKITVVNARVSLTRCMNEARKLKGKALAYR